MWDLIRLTASSGKEHVCLASMWTHVRDGPTCLLLIMQLIWSGPTLTMSCRKATNLSHYFFASANSPFNFSLSFFNLLFSLDKSGQWVFGSTDPVEVDPISSPPELDADFLPSSTDFYSCWRLGLPTLDCWQQLHLSTLEILVGKFPCV